MYEISIPFFLKALQNLNHFLKKAEAFALVKNFDVEILLNSRLAPDQFSLLQQIRAACYISIWSTYALIDKPCPTFEDNEKSLSDIRARIDQTIMHLQSVNKENFEGVEGRTITFERWQGKWMTSHDFLHHHALPNLYFHVSTTYSILRHNGVDLGKKDYLGDMPYKK